MRILVVLFCLAMLGFGGPAWADGPLVRAEASTATIACAGAAAEVNGGHNTLTFTGVCKGLLIRGEANNVTVALAPGALIDIEGNGNHVKFTAAGAPRLKISGSHNQVLPQPGAPAPAADTAKLSGDDLDVVLDCHGNSVTLQGVRVHYQLRGACRALTVRGESNIVQAEFAPKAQVLVEGNGITLTYTVVGDGAAPDIAVHGMGSSVQRAGGPSAAPAATTAQATDPLPVLIHDLDATIVKTGTLVKLPEAVFSGAAVAPAGESQLGKLAALIAMIHPAGLQLTGHDPADPVLAAQRVALVRSWLEAHGVSVPVQRDVNIAPAGVDVLILRQP
jgi:hypothetical protein